jgi:hypothetical protein
MVNGGEKTLRPGMADGRSTSGKETSEPHLKDPPVEKRC